MNKPITDGARSARSRLADSDGRFRFIFDAINEGIFISDLTTGRFVEVNEPGCRMFGYTRAELIGCTIVTLSSGVHPYTQETAIELLQKAASDGPQTFEWKGKSKSGVLFWTEISLRFTEFGEIPAIVAIVRDINERKLSHDKLREAQAALVEAQALAHVGSFTIDLLDNRTTWSDECYRILGLDPATSVPTFDAYLARIHPDDRSALTNAYKQSLVDRAPRVLDQRIVRDDGSIRFVEQRWQNHYGADGKAERTTGTVQDVTERKNAEAALTVSGALHAVIASIAALINNPSLEEGAPEALRMVGEALNVDRCVVVENIDRPGAPPNLRPTYQWNKSGLEPLLPPFIAEMTKRRDVLSWLAPLNEGKPVIATLANANAGVKRIFRALKSTSIVLIPIVVAGRNWGHIGLNDGTPNREWTAAEIETLLALATLFGVTIERGRQIQKLADADAIIRSSPAILYRLSAEPGMPMTYISSNVNRLGYDQARMLAEPTFYRTLIHPDDRAEVADDDAKMLRGQPIAAAIEMRFSTADGAYRWFEVHRKKILGEDGKLKGLQGELIDITERKRAENALKQERDFSAALIDSLPGFVVLIDDNGRLARWNENLSTLTGLSAEQLQGLEASSIVVESDRYHAQTTLRDAFAQARMDIEFGVRADTGAARTIHWSGRAIEKDGHRYLLGAGVDVTDARAAEALLRAIALAASEIETATNLDASIRKAMDLVSTAIRIDRMGVMENPATPHSPPIYRYAWNAPDVELIIDERFFNRPTIWTPEMEAWQAPVREGKVVTSDARTATGDVKKMLEFLRTKTVLLIPITVRGKFWGIVGFDSCKRERLWPDVEINILRMVADLIGSAIDRERYVKELSDASRIIERSPTILYRLSATPDMPMTYVSTNVDRLGYDQAKVLADPTFYRTLIHPDDRARVATDQAQALRGEAPAAVFEVRFLAADGTYRWFENHRTSIAGQDGTLTGFEGELIDINERKLAKEKLEANEEQFRTIFDTVDDAIIVLDVGTTTLVDFNPRFSEMFGYTREELLKHDLADLVAMAPPYTFADAMPLLARAAAGETVTFEWLCRAKDGHDLWLSGSLRRSHFGGRDVLLATARDVTEQKRIADLLRDSEQKFRTLVETAPDYIWEIGVAGTYTYASPQVTAILGYTPGEMIGKSPLEFMFPAGRHRVAPILASHWSEQRPFSLLEYSLRRKDGSDAIVETSGMPIVDAQGAFKGYRGVDRDITARKEAERKLAENDLKLRTIMDSVQAGIIIIDPEFHKIVDVNPAAAKLFGAPREAIVGQGCQKFVCPADIGRCPITDLGQNVDNSERVLVTAAGTSIPIIKTVSQVTASGKTYLIECFVDITERKRAEAQISYSARHDFLTDLLNRAVFVEELKRAIARARRDDKGFALLYLDLDQFKDVNDTLGHPTGDLLLQEVAKRLLAIARGADTVARFGGDEFAVIDADIGEPADAAALADRVLKTLREPFSIQGNEIRIGASIGIEIYGADATDAETLLAHADVALYRAKAEGRGTYRYFTDAMNTEVRTRVAVNAELRDAITSGQLFLMYQPQVNVDTGHIIGLEALVRWRHPARGIVSPGEFIPVAEKSGLIVALGQWVLHEACRQMKGWLDAGIAPPLVAVNVSAQQFKTPLELENDIAKILAETGLPPNRLELELTERVLMNVSYAHNEALQGLRKSGLRIAIDDFGTGYSSLEYLGHFPVDRIKIGQNFTLNLTTNTRNVAIMKAAISMAHELGLDVIVEGVETREQLELIRSLSGHKVQGFYFSKPLPAAEVTALLGTDKLSWALPPVRLKPAAA